LHYTDNHGIMSIEIILLSRDVRDVREQIVTFT